MKTLNILGQKYSLKYTDLSKEELCGKCDPDKLIIYVDKNMSPTLTQLTVVHELVHAAFFRIGVPSTNLDNNTIEIFCDVIAAVIQENFKLDLS